VDDGQQVEVRRVGPESRLFRQFAQQCPLRPLVVLRVTAGEAPEALVLGDRFVEQQHLRSVVDDGVDPGSGHWERITSQFGHQECSLPAHSQVPSAVPHGWQCSGVTATASMSSGSVTPV
jgi:hypothetical protein